MDLIAIGKIVGLCLFAYLFGSIPFGYIVCWAKGVDIKKVGSGKIGGTNVRRALGWRYAIWVSTLDAWKGAVPIFVTIYVLKGSAWVVGLVFLFCILGAILSIWMKLMTGTFRAGAGIAVLIGGLLILAGWQVWLMIMGCWLIVFLFFVRRKMSAASLSLIGIILIVLPVLVCMMPLLLFVFALIGWAHRENLQRIINGEEPSIKVKLPWFFNKIPDDLVSWTIEKLQRLIKKLQGLP